MRCSSCEAMLDRYVEGDLEPARATAVAMHLQSCEGCEALHRRVRVVDGLLATVRPATLDRDFTFDVMARVRELPTPALPRRSWLPLAAFYLIAAWIVAAAAIVPAWGAAPVHVGALLHGFGETLGILARGARGLIPAEPLALAFVIALLAVDALLFAAVAVFYRRVRPRLHAYLTAEVR